MATTEKLSAKAAAIEIGTDARTLRKFLRSDSSTFEACGQGNRYEFTAGQLKKLKKEFEAWGGGKAPAKKKAKEPIAQEPDDDDTDLVSEDDIEIDDEPEDEDDDSEVDEDELIDIDDIEIDEDED